MPPQIGESNNFQNWYNTLQITGKAKEFSVNFTPNQRKLQNKIKIRNLQNDNLSSILDTLFQK